MDRALVADAVARAVARAPGVARLSPGVEEVEVDTQFAGGKVVGVAVGDSVVSVHVVIDRLPVAEALRAARATGERVLVGLGAPQRLDLVVDDLEVSALPDPAATTPHQDAAKPGRRGRSGRRSR